MSIAKFPDEVLLKIFSFLPWTDLVSVRKTCSRWQELSEDNILLHKLARDFSERWGNEYHHPSSDEISFAILLGKLSLIMVLKVSFISLKQGLDYGLLSMPLV